MLIITNYNLAIDLYSNKKINDCYHKIKLIKKENIDKKYINLVKILRKKTEAIVKKYYYSNKSF